MFEGRHIDITDHGKTHKKKNTNPLCSAIAAGSLNLYPPAGSASGTRSKLLMIKKKKNNSCCSKCGNRVLLYFGHYVLYIEIHTEKPVTHELKVTDTGATDTVTEWKPFEAPSETHPSSTFFQNILALVTLLLTKD